MLMSKLLAFSSVALPTTVKVPSIVLLVPGEMAPKLSKEQNHKYSHEVLKFMAEQDNNKPKDMRAWAKRIIANPKNYPPISLKFAKEAINAN